MTRQSRTFKLRLSPAGMDLLIDAHCRLIRATRGLIAWGTTLQIAVECLDTAPASIVEELLATIAGAGLDGDQEHHLGAPKGLNVMAARIADDVARVSSGIPSPLLANIYIAALTYLLRVEPDQLRATYQRVRLN